MPMLRAYHDGVLGNRFRGSGAPNRLRSYRDGIFGLGADTLANYDLADAEALKQFKLVLNYVMSKEGAPALTSAAIDSSAYGVDTETVFQAWAAAQPDAASMAQSVKGHVIPTTSGLFHLFDQGIKASGPDYAGTYWPIPWAYHATIVATGPGATMSPPKFDTTGREGALRASTLVMGGVAAALVIGGFALMKKKR